MFLDEKPKPTHRVLFVCNKKIVPGYGYQKIFSGLYNSARMISEMLNDECNITSKIVRVDDSNYINAAIHKFKPTVVVLEALWVPVGKLKLLQSMYPNIKWIVRIHSEVPFLANEGNAIKLIKEYMEVPNVHIACNSERAQYDLDLPGQHLPNYYPVGKGLRIKPHEGKELHIGCFGSIRPMKNQLLQALTALKFAESLGYTLHFHMNTTRQEQGGEQVLKNIRELFSEVGHHLVEHPWMDPSDFKKLLKKMDLVMQVSLTETFNIVAADASEVGIPLVCSKEIRWADDMCYADPTSGRDILHTMYKVWSNKTKVVMRNFYNLKEYSYRAQTVWLRFINSI